MAFLNSGETSLTRRKVIKSMGVAPIGGLAMAGSEKPDNQDDCEYCCGGLIENKTQIQSSNAPDFHVTGVDENGDDASFPVYWKSQNAFENQGYQWAIALAWNRRDIWLNEGMKERISPAVIAHEYGHCIGYDHIDGTIMGAGTFKMDDADVDVALTNTTTDIVDRMENVEIINWSNNGSLTKLGDIASQYAQGQTNIVTLSKAAKKYVLEKQETVWFSTDWDNYGSYEEAHESNTGNQFYSQTL